MLLYDTQHECRCVSQVKNQVVYLKNFHAIKSCIYRILDFALSSYCIFSFLTSLLNLYDINPLRKAHVLLGAVNLDALLDGLESLLSKLGAGITWATEDELSTEVPFLRDVPVA